MSDKPKFPRAVAMEVAAELCRALKSCTMQLVVAGSLRRRKAMVGDVEILYEPIQVVRQPAQAALLTELEDPAKKIPLVDLQLAFLLDEGVLKRRLNRCGSVMWGDQNKYAVHVATGIPVDFFSVRPAAWWNYVVCRTGGAESNTRIASAAQAKRWKWHPYDDGFTDHEGKRVRVECERDVFRLVGLPYQEPWERQ